MPHAGDGDALADGAFGAGAQRVSGLEVAGALDGRGGELGLAGVAGMHGELAALDPRDAVSRLRLPQATGETSARQLLAHPAEPMTSGAKPEDVPF